MENTNIITIKDGKIEKKFIITKLKCINTLLLTHKLAGMLAKTNEITPDTIKQLIFSKMGSGIAVEGVDKKDVDALMNIQLFELLFNVVKSMLAGIDDEKQLEVLRLIISCIHYQNGANPIQLDAYPGSDRNIDLYVEDVSTLYKLLWEVLKLHYGHFFLTAKK